MTRLEPFTLFLRLIIMIGLGLVAFALALEGPIPLLGPRRDLFLCFSLLVVLAESRPVVWLRRKQGAVITAAPSFNAALLFLTPGLGAAVAAGLLSAIGDLTCGRPPIKVIFNAAMMTITMTVASMLMLLSGDRLALIEDGAVTPWWMLVVTVALVAYNVVNDLIVSTIVALSEGLPIFATVRQDIVRNLQTDGVLLGLGPVMVVVAVRSILMLPVLLAVTIIVLNTTRMALERLHQATHDPLTGLPNRRLFDEHLAGLLQRRSTAGRVVVMALDLDKFKEINDTLGHDVGDRVLQAVSERLEAAVPHNAIVARLGGDEFAIVLPDLRDLDDPQAVGDAIHSAFTGSLADHGLPLTIGGSLGIAVAHEGSTVDHLMRRADMAMYRAKAAGGGVEVQGPDSDGAVRAGRRSLLDQLESALAAGQLLLHYQPIVGTKDRDVVGAEALIRWQHPELGMVPPSEFIPTVEQTDLIEPLTDFVLTQALADCANFERLGHDLFVTVNLSARSAADTGLPRKLRQMLASAGVDPTKLTLELTENALMSEPERVAQVLTEIRSLGVKLALDDFGTGFSSLSNLRDLPLDIVKVDRSFVSTMGHVDDDAAIVAMVLQLAKKLGLTTVAEGVEFEQIAAQLGGLNCDRLQGYLIAKPMPFHSFAAWLAEGANPDNIPAYPAIGSTAS